MKFSEFPYQRPDIDALEQSFNELLEAFNAAESAEAQAEVLRQITALRTEYQSNRELAECRHTIDSRDEFYDAEQTFFDTEGPRYTELVNRLDDCMLNSRFRPELEKIFGRQLFVLSELSLKTFKPSILEDLKRENSLKSEYSKLLANAKIEFDGAERTLSEMFPYETNKDRDVRIAATRAKWQFFADNKAELDRIYDDMVKTRTSIAHKLGHTNFIETGYARLTRSDYNADDVAAFRENVLKYIVPAAVKLRERQARRLGLDSLKIYDEGFSFPSGNAKPQGPPEWIVDRGSDMYRELSPETNEFFSFMRNSELMDLVSKPGKRPGGYCTTFVKHKAPFIFSNFNGTAGDIDVLTHEAGHAFQVYSSLDHDVLEYHWPTYEACEIHSMSMEFFAWPWMKLFFGEDTEKYKFAHLSGALLFIPYGVAVDEFQHFVYANPTASPDERHAAWRRIERKYLPYRDHDGIEYLENGGFWQKQSHIYSEPFYYIDYTLAQICAFQFWKRSREDREAAWSDYVKLCRAGGSMSFLDLVKLAGLHSPFDPAAITGVIGEIESWLDSVDDMAL